MNSKDQVDDDDDDDEEQDDRKSPEKVMSKTRVVILAFSFCGFYAIVLLLSTSVVPAQVEVMVGQSSKGRWLGALVLGVSVMQGVAGLVLGPFSDRLTSRFGRRRPVMVVSAFVICISLLGLVFTGPSLTGAILREAADSSNCSVNLEDKRCEPYENSTAYTKWVNTTHENSEHIQHNKAQGNIVLYSICLMVGCLAFAGFAVSYNGLVADKSTPDIRGFVSGFVGTMTMLGYLTGAGMVVFLSVIGVGWTLTVMIFFFALSVIITVFFTPEIPRSKMFTRCTRGLKFKSMISAFWKPFKDANFRWVWITRFLAQQGFCTVVGFLHYWVSDVVGVPYCWATMKALSLLLIPLLIMAAFGSVLFGRLSDKYRSRLPFIVSSALLMGFSTLAMPFTRGQYGFIIALVLAVTCGGAFGAYMAVSFALAIDVLPAEKDTAKDLAVWNMALVLSQAIAVPLGGLLLDFFQQVNCRIALGYIVVYVMGALYFLLCAGLTLKIKLQNHIYTSEK